MGVQAAAVWDLVPDAAGGVRQRGEERGLLAVPMAVSVGDTCETCSRLPGDQVNLVGGGGAGKHRNFSAGSQRLPRGAWVGGAQ